jgi:tRNA threonylcarbamoyladenosine biosynthesis protein TsaE
MAADIESSGSLRTVLRRLWGEQAMVAFGTELGLASRPCGGVIFLEGDLGTGKTTVCRGVLQAYGHAGAVKSPTYTLVEPYFLANRHIYHFDLYRLGDPEELEYMGIRDYFQERQTLCLVEWAEKGGMFLPAADLIVRIKPLTGGRAVSVTAQTATGEAILSAIDAIDFTDNDASPKQ